MIGETSDQFRDHRSGIIIAAVLITILAMIILFELMSSELLIYRYRHDGVLLDGNISSFVLLKKAAYTLGWRREPGFTGPVETASIPSPFERPDPIFGWSAIPGRQYTITYKRKSFSNDGSGSWVSFPVKATINSDGSRWTGMPAQPQKPTIYVLGDSFVFGWGVNDEQTFSYYLQMARPNYNVKLFALEGYGLVQSYLRIQQLKSEISEHDIVIIGYADFYDRRNVAAPSILRNQHWLQHTKDLRAGMGGWPKASIEGNGQLSITLKERDCRLNPGYCQSDDPSLSEMRAVSLRLIHEIATATKAKTYLLHITGSKDNPVVQNCGVEVISALKGDFGYFIRDDVQGLDSHPGPYWHYAIAQKLISRIK